MLQDKYRIYILSYNNSTLSSSIGYFHKYSWAKCISIDTTVYLENIMYDSWLSTNINDWIRYDYVGTLSWRSPIKIKMPELNSLKLAQKLEDNSFEIVSFNRIRKPLLKYAVSCHGDIYKSLWINILEQLGFNLGEILDSKIPNFVCNYWMARPTVMQKYIEFFHKVKNVIINNSDIQNDLWSDSHYNGYVSKIKLMQIFNKPYYPMLPFILERLPCFFCYHYGYKLLNYAQKNEKV